MTLRTGRLRQDAPNHGATMGPARLGGVPGIGTLQVVRGQRDEVLEVLGTWRPDRPDREVGSLEEAARLGTQLEYDGHYDDPGDGRRDHVTARVTVSSWGTYAFDAVDDPPVGAEDGEATPTFTLFNLRTVGDGMP